MACFPLARACSRFPVAACAGFRFDLTFETGLQVAISCGDQVGEEGGIRPIAAGELTVVGSMGGARLNNRQMPGLRRLFGIAVLMSAVPQIGTP